MRDGENPKRIRLALFMTGTSKSLLRLTTSFSQVTR